MTKFQELCYELGVLPNSEAERALSRMVNEMIFSKVHYTDEEIFAAVCKRFAEKYL